MILAGPVFTEWYWTPFFLIFFFGPPVALGAGAVVLVASRRATRRGGRLRSRAALFGTACITIFCLLAIGDVARTQVRFDADVRAALPHIDFAAFEPESVPAGLDPQRTSPEFFGDEGYVVFSYEAEGGFASLIEQAGPGTMTVSEPCSLAIHDLQGVGTTFYEGPCEALEDAMGRQVVLTVEAPPGSRSAFQLRDGTLLHVRFAGLETQEVVDLFDLLQAREADEIDYFTTLDY
jgi:hypothetical protein